MAQERALLLGAQALLSSPHRSRRPEGLGLSASQTGGSSGLSWQLPSALCPLLFPHACLLSSLGKCNLSRTTFNHWDAVVLSLQGNKGSILLSMLGALRVPKEGGRGNGA